MYIQYSEATQTRTFSACTVTERARCNTQGYVAEVYERLPPAAWSMIGGHLVGTSPIESLTRRHPDTSWYLLHCIAGPGPHALVGLTHALRLRRDSLCKSCGAGAAGTKGACVTKDRAPWEY